MSRKDYRIIALALRESQAPHLVCLHMAKLLAAENPRFNMTVFVTACGH